MTDTPDGPSAPHAATAPRRRARDPAPRPRVAGSRRDRDEAGPARRRAPRPARPAHRAVPQPDADSREGGQRTGTAHRPRAG